MNVYEMELDDWISALRLPQDVKSHALKTIRIIDIANESAYHRHACKNLDIALFSDEWITRNSQVKGFLRSRLKNFDRRVYARLCDVRPIDKTLAVKFIDEHHIQGRNNLGIVAFGIFHADELVGVMSLGRHHRKIDNTIVLDRLCFKNGVHVPGGASRLFKRCIQWAKDYGFDGIVSWSDNRWGSGNVYSKLHFVCEKEYPPDYSYVDSTSSGHRRLSKQSQKKSSSRCPAHLTERQWAEERGLRRIYDKGKKRWYYELKTPESITVREKLSLKCAQQHAEGIFMHGHIRGYFDSIKNGKKIYFASSYELRCLYELEHDVDIVKFGRCEAFKVEGRWRNPDLRVETDSGTEIWEVKPAMRLMDDEVKSQINDTIEYCNAKNYKFKLWTEESSQLSSEKSIIKWAKDYLSKYGLSHLCDDQRKSRSRERAVKYYRNVVSKDKVSVYCEFCRESHSLLRQSYDRNISKNGRFICIKENGSIIGRRAKTSLRKVNPHAGEGKKECNKCKEVKPFEDFRKDRSKRDGVMTRCRRCTR